MTPGSGDERSTLAARLALLARATAELAGAHDLETVTTVITRHTADAVGAVRASMTMLLTPDTLTLVGFRGRAEDDPSGWQTFPLGSSNPASDTVRTGVRLVLTDPQTISERYPTLPSNGLDPQALVCLPLRGGSPGSSETTALGSIGLAFSDPRTFDEAELEFLDIMADTCGQALQRIRAADDAARQTARLDFLAESSAAMGRSLDYAATLAEVARLAVPDMADWCAIDLFDDGQLHRLAVAHIDEEKVKLARELHERYPPAPSDEGGAWEVARTGRSNLFPEITDAMLVAGSKDEEHLALARGLHLRSALTVPVVARGRVLGVLTWVMAESERRYDETDLVLAESIGGRAGFAIDNAQLYSQTLEAAATLQRAVLPEAFPDVPGWDVATHYAPSGRTDVGGDFFDVLPLLDGRVVLFLGDVMGRGVQAAAAMAQLRASVRAFAALDPDPATVLERLDVMFAAYEMTQLVTLFYAVADLEAGRLVFANAGHPPPLVVRRDGGADYLPLAEGGPLGTVSVERHNSHVGLGHGDLVLTYTDGLIERRDEDIDVGLHRLLTHATLEDLMEHESGLDRLAHAVCDPMRDDDVAVLALRSMVLD